MYFEPEHFYHIYNKGNQGKNIFFSDENYIFFLQKIRKFIKPFAEIIAYCLMPNHYHLMLMATDKGCERDKQGIQILARKIGVLQSSYSQAVNKRMNTKWSLFRQKANAKDLWEFDTKQNKKSDYNFTCFFYIHKNPVKAGLVANAEDWQYSSYVDYIGKRNGTLINKELALEILNLDAESIEANMEKELENVEKIFVD